MSRLAGKIAIVTGGARGLGAAQVRRLAREGAKVVVADLLEQDGAALARELGPGAIFHRLDVSSSAQWADAVEATAQAFGPVNVLVNNAGVGGGGPLAETSDEQWRRMIDINLTGVFYGMRACIPVMVGAGGGSVINIASINGVRPNRNRYGYVASKFGVMGLTKAAALDFAGQGVRVNAVLPGLIETEMSAKLNIDPAVVPIGRIGQPDDVARMVAFLASEESSYSTGGEFLVEGGALLGVAGQ
ncbi:3-alpha-hydroxysteroid dehydrogenase [Sphingobium sp. 22B]|uniref:SDR family NAD(P)-dependent oxidoreductase n=1 Tax=unclassified Sphingobium TaxID=2611147 RepID=UPI0007806618|nr:MULTISPECIES: glucose 1-dehydrogenase [unclassified Sphingobium]KXU30506.1 3-alpha-hydroxysteroid dehydrogenase [Sphingobium sp. AM]KYC30765.1 3-alpha-hydroxysteroid dehydrogenase [Sphingobium sp. 22B]OAP30062.1 3-alpha-hydroxysteroid dehydrogenase [Sphingobium sp. 20006FA]